MKPSKVVAGIVVVVDDVVGDDRKPHKRQANDIIDTFLAKLKESVTRYRP